MICIHLHTTTCVLKVWSKITSKYIHSNEVLENFLFITIKTSKLYLQSVTIFHYAQLDFHDIVHLKETE